MQQATLDTWLETAGAGDDGGDDEWLWDAGLQVLRCIVYMYTCAATGEPVYVGQTVRRLARRDAEHLGGRQTGFDRAYTDRGMFVLTELEVGTFEGNVQSADQDKALLAQAAAWLDAREAHWIAHHGTHCPRGEGRGMNQTAGGQLGLLAACAQAARRRSHVAWRTVYAPAFERWMLDKGTDSLLHVAQCDVVQSPASADGTLQLGTLVNNIRSGGTAVPAAWRAWLDVRGFVWNYQAAIWERVNIPAFERWMLDKGTDSLLHVAQRDVVQSPASADGTLPLGQLVSSIRSGNAAVPDAWRAWLDARGFAWNYQAAIWERVNIPAFGRWMLDKGTDSLLHIPSGAGVRGIVQSPASADGTLQLGRLVNSIRSDTTAVPAAWRAWLDARGFLWHTQNLAAHVARRLQRAAPVDPGADADATVALSQLYGSGAFGRATCESLDGIVARYNADRARL